eukprot:14001606-Alexandrium_andersonii.AAC.1
MLQSSPEVRHPSSGLRNRNSGALQSNARELLKPDSEILQSSSSGAPRPTRELRQRDSGVPLFWRPEPGRCTGARLR